MVQESGKYVNPHTRISARRTAIVLSVTLFAGLIFGILGFRMGYLKGFSRGEEFVEATASVTPETTDTPSPVASTSATDITANWKTYTNDTYGFSFKYPTRLNPITKTTDEESSTKFLALSEDPEMTTMAQEGCSGQYMMGVSDQTSSFDTRISTSAFDGIDNLKIDKSTLNGHRHAKVTGIAATMAYVSPGAGILIGMIEIIPSTISFSVCNKSSNPISEIQASEFDQILSTIQFTK